jgi:hypothetical protein
VMAGDLTHLEVAENASGKYDWRPVAEHRVTDVHAIPCRDVFDGGKVHRRIICAGNGRLTGTRGVSWRSQQRPSAA